MAKLMVSLPAKWEQFLKRLANDHQVDLNSVISELCAWAFTNSEIKKQFELWMDNAFPPQGYAEDRARATGARERAREEEAEEEYEEEAHEDRDYSEDREIDP
jgi:ribosomal protein L12E/L44/L45/RPP1/RPP2